MAPWGVEDRESRPEGGSVGVAESGAGEECHPVGTSSEEVKSGQGIPEMGTKDPP